MREPQCYILDADHVAIPVNTLVWAAWFETNDRRVRRDEWPDGVVVSTVFLGLDHAFTAKEPRQIFETMVFGGEFAHETDRYATWEQAERGHAAMVRRIGRTVPVRP